MMDSEWGKNIQKQSHYFSTHLMGLMETHSVQFCFQNEDGLQQFIDVLYWFSITQLLGEKLGKYITPVSQQLNTPMVSE